jgi:hypothetical protein
MNTYFLIRNVALAVVLLSASTDWAMNSPFAEGSKLIITNKTLQSKTLEFTSADGSKKKGTVYPIPQVSKLIGEGEKLEEVFFDTIKFNKFGDVSVMKTAYVSDPVTNKEFPLVIRYWPYYGKVTLQAGNKSTN